jgi:3-oxoacyl-(acyl-carrier-protein) synthase
MVTPAGNDVATTWATLLAGRSQGAPITIFDASGFSTRIAAEVKGFDPRAVIDDRRILKFANRSHAFALAAADQALADAGMRPTPATGGRWGLSVGTGMQGLSWPELSTLGLAAGDGEDVDPAKLVASDTGRDPLVFCRAQSTAGLALLGRRHGIHGYATSVHTACASGGQAIGTALKLIRRGTVDFALAGGFDSMVNPVGLAGFCLLGAVSPDNDDPSRASRPFDASRNGFVLGEGAGFVVLEPLEHARARGARIYAELAGDGNSLSSYRITDSHPSGDGPIQAMRWALADADATAADVDYVNAHGTSTPMNDRSESAAMHAVFGADVARVSVSSTKSTMGHLIAGAGAVEAAVCALAIHHGTLPVNANYRDPDPDCDLNLVTGEPRAQRVRVALSNSLGFGGSNSCLAFRHPDYEPPPDARSARLPKGGRAPSGRPSGREGGR